MVHTLLVVIVLGSGKKIEDTGETSSFAAKEVEDTVGPGTTSGANDNGIATPDIGNSGPDVDFSGNNNGADVDLFNVDDTWDIILNGDKKFGVVESRFCFEGGSRCGKGEGLYILVTDQGEEITKTLQLAAEGKLTSKKRPNKNCPDSPKKSNNVRSVTKSSELGEDHLGQEEVLIVTGPGSLTDTTSVCHFKNMHDKENQFWQVETAIERCSICMSKYGATSSSSTASKSQSNTLCTSGWNMESKRTGNKLESKQENHAMNFGYYRTNIPERDDDSHQIYTESRNLNDSHSDRKERCHFFQPVRPPRLNCLSSPLPPRRVFDSNTTQLISCPRNIAVNPFDNYDIPKPLEGNPQCKFQTHCSNSISSSSDNGPELYDKPKKINDRESYNTNMSPPHVKRKQLSVSLQDNQYLARVISDNEDIRTMPCPCHRMMCWADSLIFSPYCQKENSHEITPSPMNKKKTTIEEGREKNIAIYTEEDTSELACYNKKPNETSQLLIHENSCMKNHDVKHRISILIENTSINEKFKNYINFDFVQSLELYENSKDMVRKPSKDKSVARTSINIENNKQANKDDAKLCTKCGHECQVPPSVAGSKQDDYLMMEPSVPNITGKACEQLSTHFSKQYLPINSLYNPTVSNQSVLNCRLYQHMQQINDRAVSSTSLTEHVLNKYTKINDSEIKRSTGFFTPSINPSVSAADCTCVNRKIPTYLHESIESNNSRPITRCSECSTKNIGVKRFLRNEKPCFSKSNNIVIENKSTHKILNNKTSNMLHYDFGTPINYISGEKKYDSLPSLQNLKHKDNCKYDSCEPTIDTNTSHTIQNKSSDNKDSSCSNDSGVSNCLFSKKKGDFRANNIQLERHYTCRKGDNNFHCGCYYTSLLKKSKSTDALDEYFCHFEKTEIPMKYSSVETEIPIFDQKQDIRGSMSPGLAVHYIDSHSNSSDNSDMSDYFETLSTSSNSLSDTHENLQKSQCKQLGKL